MFRSKRMQDVQIKEEWSRSNFAVSVTLSHVPVCIDLVHMMLQNRKSAPSGGKHIPLQLTPINVDI